MSDYSKKSNDELVGLLELQARSFRSVQRSLEGQIEKLKQQGKAFSGIEEKIKCIIKYYHQFDNTKWEGCCNGRECACAGKPSDPEYYIWKDLMDIERELEKMREIA